MADLRVPSLQHMARNWEPEASKIAKRLVELVENPPIFSYEALFSAVRDLLVLGVPYEQIEKGIMRMPRENVRDIFLGVLPLIRDYFGDVSPTFVQTVKRRYYPVGRGLMVPFSPPLIYGVGGQLHFPWLSFWRNNPLADEALSLFVTLVDDLLRDDPDLEDAQFRILDFSAPDPKKPRELKVVETVDIPRVSEERKLEMLSVFASGFHAAREQLKGMRKSSKKEDSAKDAPKGPDLFDGK